MSVTRNMIVELLKKLNDAENSRPDSTVEKTISAIDSLCAPDFEIRSNNGPFNNREAERGFERWLFTEIPDYNRTIEQTVIDPPYFSFEWILRGTVDNKGVEIHGCSILECNEDGLLKRGTVYVDTSQFPTQPG